MKPISAWHKYALRDEMTTDALNFRELAFRQTSSRPRPPPARTLAPQTTSQASRPPGLAGTVAGSSRNSPHLRRPLRRGRPWRAAPSSPPPADRRVPAGVGFPSESSRELRPSREEPERAGYLPARPSSCAAEKDREAGPLSARAAASRLWVPTRGRAHARTHKHTYTHARPLHTRAHTHTHRLARIGTPARAHARSHSGCNKGRGQRCLTFLPLLFCGPLAPGRRPAHPPSAPPDGGGRLAAGAARRSGNFAPGGRETKAAALPEAARPRCAR